MNTNTSTPDQLKELVQEKYGEIAKAAATKGGCCGSDCGCSTVDYAIMADEYKHLSGYNEEADLGLGCGLPTEHALISEGDFVVDLGSGAGNDAFVARSIVGEKGFVIGVDLTEPMIERATANAAKMKFHNVRFVKGDIENIPLGDSLANVVVSNCVFNLVPDKSRAFAETFRILKPGGHFSISDIVLVGELPEELRKSAELYAGCVSGAIQKDEYLATIKNAGFENVKVQKEKRINLPDEILSTHLSPDQMKSFKEGRTGIVSITVYGEKKSTCCGTDCCA